MCTGIAYYEEVNYFINNIKVQFKWYTQPCIINL